MRSIFSYAKASLKVVDLLCRDYGCKREELTCDSRLESDLGLYGIDAYELLDAMETELNVDMSNFDSHDRITPEYMTPVDFVVIFSFYLGGVASVLAATSMLPDRSSPCFMLIGVLGACFAAWVSTRFIRKAEPCPELRVRDLICAVEAKRWVSPQSA